MRGTADLAGNAVTAAKIKDGEVKAPEIAANAVGDSEIATDAVTGSKIADGTIAYADVSRVLIAVEHRNYCNCGGTGWDPDGMTTGAFIYVDRISRYSVVVVTPSHTPIVCGAYGGYLDHHVVVRCNSTIPNGMGISYAIFNNPTYG